MSCKLWLNVWTCRSFTCPFTLRNLDRNPTAALISGFIVPRAQRVCIEKGNGYPRAFVVFFSTCSSNCSSPLLGSDPYQFVSFLLAFICRGRGRFFSVCQDGSVLGNRRLLLVNTGGVFGEGGPWCHVDQPTLFTVFLQSEALRMGERVYIAPPPSPQPRHKLLQQQRPTNQKAAPVWRATYRRSAAFTSPLWK